MVLSHVTQVNGELKICKGKINKKLDFDVSLTNQVIALGKQKQSYGSFHFLSNCHVILYYKSLISAFVYTQQPARKVGYISVGP